MPEVEFEEIFYQSVTPVEVCLIRDNVDISLPLTINISLTTGNTPALSFGNFLCGAKVCDLNSFALSALCLITLVGPSYSLP